VLLLLVLIVAAFLLPIMWADKTYRDMRDIGWADAHDQPIPWGLIIICGVITLFMLSALG